MASKEKKDIVIAENRSFEGVWIPRKLYTTNKFNLRTKFFIVEVKSLSKNGYCFATDKHFADFLGISERMVQTMIKQLKDDGYLTAEYRYREGTSSIERRYLILTKKFLDEFYNEKEAEPIEKNCNTPTEINYEEPIEENCDRGTEKNYGENYNNVKYNNNSNNTDSNITDNSFSKEKEESNSPKGNSNSFSSEKKSGRSPKQKKPLSEKELEQANAKMPYRAKCIALNLTGNEDLADDVMKFFEYFLAERKRFTGTWHIPLNDTTLAKVIATITEDIKVDRGDYDDTYFALIDDMGNEDYKEVVDKYFKTKFKNKTDYSIVHFTQENVLINIMNHCGKENWCMSGI